MKSKWFLAFPVIILLVFVVICISTVVEKPEKQKSVKKQKTASEVGESVGQTSGNFVQGMFKGLFKSTKDGK